MDLYQLRYFVEAARQRSFTRAAKRLDLATPALSIQIQKLEAELGAKLFVRGQRQSVLTPAGEVLFEKAQALLGMADSVKQAVAEVSELRAGRLAVAFVPALGTYWLPEVFQSFRGEYPCVKLALEEDDALGVAARVEDSSVELGLLDLPVNDQLFEIEKVWEEPVLAVLPQHHPLASKPSLALDELTAESFVVQRGAAHQQTLEACRRAGFEPRVACECSEKETAIALVQAGLGVMLLPQLAAAVPRLSLGVLPVSKPKLVRQFGLIRRSGRELSAAARAFVEVIKRTPFPLAPKASAAVGKRRAPEPSLAPLRATGASEGARAPEALLTPLRFLERGAHTYSERTAIRHGRQRQTYSQFAEDVRTQASALLAAGLGQGDRVAFICANAPPLLAAHFSVPLAGGVLVPINTRLAAGEIAYILNHSGARFLFVDSEFAAAVRPLRGHLDQPLKFIEITDSHRTKAGDHLTYAAFLKAGSSKPIAWSLKSEDELISLNYTSGTTGKPKGVMISHRGAYINALGNIIHLGLSSDSNVLWTLPMFHCNGWGMIWAATAVGATHTCLQKFDPAVVWRIMVEERVSHVCGAPSLLTQLLNLPDRPPALPQPLTVVVGGAPTSAELIQQWEKLGARVLHAYGLTETCGPIMICEPQPEWRRLPTSERVRQLTRQGVPYVTGETVRVVDDKLRDVQADGRSVGEVIMRGASVTPGYYKEPQATALDFRDGWFHTGDLAVVHPDGYLELRDRQRDIIIVDSEHMSSLEIELALNQHPAVAEAAVIGVPDKARGETPKAFIVLKAGEKTTPEALTRFCRDRLAAFKCPTHVEFVRKLPRTRSGKVQKFVLREKEWSGHEARIHGV